MSLSLDTGLPANLDAERTILGSLLLDPERLLDVVAALSADDFSLDSHRRILLRMVEASEEFASLDIVSLANTLAKHKEVESIGGVAYLASLTEGLPRRPEIADYLKIVKDKSICRQLMVIGSAAMARAQDRKSTRLNSSHITRSRMPSSA